MMSFVTYTFTRDAIKFATIGKSVFIRTTLLLHFTSAHPVQPEKSRCGGIPMELMKNLTFTLPLLKLPLLWEPTACPLTLDRESNSNK